MIKHFIAALLAFTCIPVAAQSALPTFPGQTEADYVARDFTFRSGEKTRELRIHYMTLGTPHRDARGHIDNAVMVLHGTGGTGQTFLRPMFAGELFGPGQPLDLARYYVILPDGLGHGKSSKPSDGLHMRFPKYDYADMVEAQHRLLVEGLKLDHLRLLMGTSMGCMHAFVWGETYPGFAHALMPMACLPVELAGRNRIWRKMSIDAVEADPAWMGGEYKVEPTIGLRAAAIASFVAGSAPVRLQHDAPTRAAAEAFLAGRIEAAVAGTDANDLIYYTDASRTYDPSKALEKITVPVAWINSGDDFINPPGLHIAEAMVGRMPNATFRLIPESAETHGHGTHTWATFWKADLIALLKRSE